MLLVFSKIVESIQEPVFITDSHNILYKNTCASIIFRDIMKISSLISAESLMNLKNKGDNSGIILSTVDGRRYEFAVLYDVENFFVFKLKIRITGIFTPEISVNALNSDVDSVIIINSEQNIIACNKKAEEFYSRNCNELYLVKFDQTNNEYIKHLASYVPEAIHGKVPVFKNMVIRQNGHNELFKINIYPVLSGEDIVCVVMICVNSGYIGETENYSIRKSALMDNVTVAAQKLFADTSDGTNFKDTLQEVLKGLAVSYDADRVYLCQFDKGKAYSKLICEWAFDPKFMLDGDIRFVYHWKSAFDHNQAVRLFSDNITDEEELWLGVKTISSYVFPVKINSQLWGFIGVDSWDNELMLTTLEEDMIKSMGILMGTALNTRRVNIKLNEYKERFESVADATGELLWEMDGGLNITYLSDKCEQITGYTRQELLGKNVTEVVKKGLKINDASFINPTNFRNFESKLIRKDGETIWIDSSGKVFFKDGTLVKVQGNSIDITKSKNTAIALNNTKEELLIANRKLEHSAKVAIKLAEETKKANRAKTEFLSNMSHEIKTPMNAILGILHVLMLTGLKPEQQEYMEKVQASAQSLLRIINDILDYSKIESGKMNIEKTDFNLEEVFTGITDIMMMEASKKGIDMLISIQPEIPKNLRGDPLRLGQVITNLVGNAVKFTDAGEVAIYANIEKETADNVELRFTIKDTGIGIEKENMEKLFQAFMQEDSGITRSYGGTGLGLALSKNIVDLMGGKIWAESIKGFGTTFYFTASFEKNASSHSKNTQTELDELNILVADDSMPSLEIIYEQLTSLGCKKITLSSSGLEAVEIISNSIHEDKNYDLLLINWKLPDISGHETVKIIDDMMSGAMHIIIITSSYEKDLAIGALKDKADNISILTKPLTASVLYETIAGIFDSTRLKGDVVDHYDFYAKRYEGMKILLVEDNQINQIVAKEILTRKGCDVTIASNGKQAVELLNNNDFDLVFMDIQMPVMSGIDAVKEIRKNPRHNDLLIYAMTAHSMKGDREKSIESGMNGHITKPIVQKELFDILDEVGKKYESDSCPLPDTDYEPDEGSMESAAKIKPDAGTNRNTWTKNDDRQTFQGKINFPEEIEGIDIIQGLDRLMGNEELYKIVLQKVSIDFPANISRLNEKLDAGDISNAIQILSEMKITLTNISAVESMHACATLEKALIHRKEYAEAYDDFIHKTFAMLKALEVLKYF